LKRKSTILRREDIMPRTSFADITLDWQKLLAAIDLHPDNLAHLADKRDELRALLIETLALHNSHSVARSGSQQTTREIEDRMKRGRELATQLRTEVRGRFGARSELLTQFNIRVFRDRPRGESPATPDEAANQLAEAAARAIEALVQAAKAAALASPPPDEPSKP
jgi:hypothetical protein